MIIYFDFESFNFDWQQRAIEMVAVKLLEQCEEEAREYMRTHKEYRDKNLHEVYMRIYSIDYLSWQNDPNFDFSAAFIDWVSEKAEALLKKTLQDKQVEVDIKI